VASERTCRRVALMAIHPEYADAILDGRKVVEFRKRSPAPDINSVLIYATSPVQRIVGEFGIDRVVRGTPIEIWRTFGEGGSIARLDFDRYYQNSKTAVALVVRWARRLDSAVPLSALTPTPTVPQSFSYVLSHQVEPAVRPADSSLQALFEPIAVCACS
jgi:predicted transcriptional regulator